MAQYYLAVLRYIPAKPVYRLSPPQAYRKCPIKPMPEICFPPPSKIEMMAMGTGPRSVEYVRKQMNVAKFILAEMMDAKVAQT